MSAFIIYREKRWDLLFSTYWHVYYNIYSWVHSKVLMSVLTKYHLFLLLRVFKSLRCIFNDLLIDIFICNTNWFNECVFINALISIHKCTHKKQVCYFYRAYLTYLKSIKHFLSFLTHLFTKSFMSLHTKKSFENSIKNHRKCICNWTNAHSTNECCDTHTVSVLIWMHEYVCANLNPKPNIIWNMYLRKQTGLSALWCVSRVLDIGKWILNQLWVYPKWVMKSIYVCVFGASEICKQREREKERFGNFEIPFETRGRCELGDDIMSICPAALLPAFPSSLLPSFPSSPSFSLSSP